MVEATGQNYLRSSSSEKELVNYGNGSLESGARVVGRSVTNMMLLVARPLCVTA